MGWATVKVYQRRKRRSEVRDAAMTEEEILVGISLAGGEGVYEDRGASRRTPNSLMKRRKACRCCCFAKASRKIQIVKDMEFLHC